MFHRGTNFTLRLILKGLGGSIIKNKSTKVSHAQETRLFDLSKDLVNLFRSNQVDAIGTIQIGFSLNSLIPISFNLLRFKLFRSMDKSIKAQRMRSVRAR